MLDLDKLWDAALGQLQNQMTRSTFETWVKTTTLVAHNDRAYQVGCQGQFAKDWLENRLFTTIHRTLSGLVGSDDIDLEFIDLEAAPGSVTNGKQPAEIPIRVRDRRRGKRYFIDREFIFEGFAAAVGPFGTSVYNVLSAHADNQGQDSHMYYSTIATLSGMSRRKVIYTITRLEEHRLIEVDRHDRQGKRANDFYLLDITEWRL
jgi:chromosomal replication initiator protein